MTTKITKEVRGKKVYIHVKDELTGFESSIVINKSEFEICVKKTKELGSTDPEKFVVLDYILMERCAVPITLGDKMKKFLKDSLGA